MTNLPASFGIDLSFHAAHPDLGDDLFAAYWRDEAVQLEWLRDFDPAGELAGLMRILLTPEDEMEEALEREVYFKSGIGTLGGDLPPDPT